MDKNDYGELAKNFRYGPIDELASALSRLPGIGPRQGKRFVYYLLAAPASEARNSPNSSLRLGKMFGNVLNVYDFTTLVQPFAIIVPTKRATRRN